jgi:putative membrane protein
VVTYRARVDPYAWSWNPEALVLVPAMTIGYLLALRRYPAPAWRIACFVAAMVLLLAVTVTPIETIAVEYLLSVHLLQNVVLAEWAPGLAVLGIPPALAALAPRVPLVPALVLWLLNYAVWHLPWLYDAALRHPHSLLHLEHALYFATGVLLWWPVVHGRHSPGVKAAYLFAAFLLASPIGLVLALVPEPLYDFYADGPGLWGLSPLTDQEIAGVTMAIAEAIVFFAAFAFFFARFFAEQDAAA